MRLKFTNMRSIKMDGILLYFAHFVPARFANSKIQMFILFVELVLIHIVLMTLIYINIAIADEAPLLDILQESRAQNIFTIVRCPTCAGQSIKDSESSAAISLQTIIRAQINQGLTDDEIITSLREVYGNQIVFQPVFDLSTAFLWIIPTVTLIIGLWFVFKRCTQPY